MGSQEGEEVRVFLARVGGPGLQVLRSLHPPGGTAVTLALPRGAQTHSSCPDPDQSKQRRKED